MFSQNHSERQCSWSCSVHTHTLISEHREQLHFLVPFALSHHTSRRPALSTTLFGFVSKTHNFWIFSKVLTYYKRLWEVLFYMKTVFYVPVSAGVQGEEWEWTGWEDPGRDCRSHRVKKQVVSSPPSGRLLDDQAALQPEHILVLTSIKKNHAPSF